MLPESELILNDDGSIYHLNLLPEDIANTIILVGDPERVPQVSNYFDTIEVKKNKREFVTHTGKCNGKRITVLSTGMGTDNIDIVLNELDALVNIDLQQRVQKNTLTSLNIIRIGTTGSLQKEIKVDEFLISKYAIGFDSLPYYYQNHAIENHEIITEFIKYTNWSIKKSTPYIASADTALFEKLKTATLHTGFTATSVGFYGPQARTLRIKPQDNELTQKLARFAYKSLKITNLEMETAGIYILAKMLGHSAVSMNCVLANRIDNTFSKTPSLAVNRLIEYTLDKITH